MHPLYMADVKESADDNVSRNTIRAEVTEEGDGNRFMDVWPDYLMDVPNEKDQDREVFNISIRIFCMFCFDKSGFESL